MNTGTDELLAFGFLILIASIFLLVNLVYELVPANRRQWLLSLGLGAGIIAFGLKIILIVTFSTLPEPTFSKQAHEITPTGLVFDQRTPSDQVSAKQQAYIWQALPETVPSPSDNPTTPAKIALGKQLFYDTRLSVDGSLSCASCHEISVKRGGGDGLPQAIGVYQQVGTRNTPTVLNAAFQRALFWDGRARSLEEQAKGPLINPIEMGMPSFEAVQERVRRIPAYKRAFSKIFSEKSPVTIDNIAKAIAAYERTLITPNSPYDHFVKGDFNALSESQRRGMALFESTGCVLCHSGPNFSGADIYGNRSVYRIFPAVPNTPYESQYQL